MNSLLQRQIKKYLDPASLETSEMKAFLQAVNDSYETNQDQFNMLQRAMTISSDELFNANQQLRKDVLVQKEVLDSITAAINTLNLQKFKSENGKFEISNLAVHIREQSEELQKAVKKQEQLLKNLETKNEVLTDYAHMVSHDLKSPLRSINSLITWIKEDSFEKLDKTGQDQFDLVLKNVEKMDALINGILNYSTIEQADFKQYEVDTKFLVKEIVESLVVPETIEIRIDENLPVICADKYRLQQLFQNLLHNAVKSIDEGPGLVEIRVKDQGELWQFEIRDNGRGISERHHSKIFKIFEKIDNDQFSTGIGLSIAKKVVDHYGGSIQLQSKEGQGTSFYFTLPK